MHFPAPRSTSRGNFAATGAPAPTRGTAVTVRPELVATAGAGNGQTPPLQQADGPLLASLPNTIKPRATASATQIHLVLPPQQLPESPSGFFSSVPFISRSTFPAQPASFSVPAVATLPTLTSVLSFMVALLGLSSHEELLDVVHTERPTSPH
jgi:hypothetical protein